MKDERLKVIPQNERVLVKSVEVENTTRSGLVITSGGDDKIRTAFATVEAVSESLKDTYEVGDIIYHNPNAGCDITLYGEKYILLTGMEVLAKLTVSDDADEVDLGEAIRENSI